MKYLNSYKSGFPVVDKIIKDNVSLLESYVARCERHEEESIEYHNTHNKGQRRFKPMMPFRPWGEYQKESCAIGCVIDLTKALAKIITPEDILVESDITIQDGLLQGSGTFKRGSEKFTFYTSSVYAGGYNIQRLHIRYLIKSSLPKNKVSKAITKKLEEKQEYLESIKRNETRLAGYLESIEMLEEDIARRSAKTKEEEYQRIYEEESLPHNIAYHKDSGYTTYRGGEKKYETFEEFMPARAEEAWEALQAVIELKKEKLKKTKEFIKKTKAVIKTLKAKLKE